MPQIPQMSYTPHVTNDINVIYATNATYAVITADTSNVIRARSSRDVKCYKYKKNATEAINVLIQILQTSPLLQKFVPNALRTLQYQFERQKVCCSFFRNFVFTYRAYFQV